MDDQDLALLALQHDGYTAEQTAHELGLSTSQVHNRYRRINAKLSVTSKRQAVERARELGLLKS